ncbi:hypothetical protein J4467_03615 [Candidatus Woesearchaeota archaeon]|nr:hypothetical protein [Candidatus Woesearchaeota archaeon]
MSQQRVKSLIKTNLLISNLTLGFLGSFFGSYFGSSGTVSSYGYGQ